MVAFIFPYKPGSESSKALSEALGIKRISHKNSRFKGNAEKTVINWGASKLPEQVGLCKVINKPEAVTLASNKLLTFQTISPHTGKKLKRAISFKGPDAKDQEKIVLDLEHGVFDEVDDDFVGWAHTAHGRLYILEPVPKIKEAVRTPDWTTSAGQAQRWLGQGCTVVERHVLNGNSGEGINLVEPEGDLTGAPLYVKYVPKKQEYRVHVCNGVAVDVQRKARRKDVADDVINWKIRNHDNGFIFARNEGEPIHPDVLVQAVGAVRLLGLDFGAVDVIFNDKQQQAYVLEVNTAPGLSGTTLEGYTERFKAMLNGEVAPDPVQPLEELVEAPKAMPEFNWAPPPQPVWAVPDAVEEHWPPEFDEDVEF